MKIFRPITIASLVLIFCAQSYAVTGYRCQAQCIILDPNQNELVFLGQEVIELRARKAEVYAEVSKACQRLAREARESRRPLLVENIAFRIENESNYYHASAGSGAVAISSEMYAAYLRSGKSSYTGLAATVSGAASSSYSEIDWSQHRQSLDVDMIDFSSPEKSCIEDPSIQETTPIYQGGLPGLG